LHISAGGCSAMQWSSTRPYVTSRLNTAEAAVPHMLRCARG
jgi:hypothetical protein